MKLNAPPPGASRVAEIVPAVLRTPSLRVHRSLVADGENPRDALGVMLRGSGSWDSVPTAVTWTVTLASWLLFGLDLGAIFVARSFTGESDIFARILTWNHHPQAAITVAVIAAVVLGATAAMTKGLRCANLLWLRVWVAGVVASVMAVAAMFIALALGLLFVAVGIAVGIFILFMAAAAIDI